MDDSSQKDQSNLDIFFQMFDWVDEDISELNEDEENEADEGQNCGQIHREGIPHQGEEGDDEGDEDGRDEDEEDADARNEGDEVYHDEGDEKDDEEVEAA